MKRHATEKPVEYQQADSVKALWEDELREVCYDFWVSSIEDVG